MAQSIFEQHEIFKTMNPIKLQVMKELVDNMQGKQMKDAAPLLMAAMTKLNQYNLSFTTEETTILLEILTKDMSPQEKARVEMMKKAVQKHSK